MMINIENEAARLGEDPNKPGYMPYVVTIYRNKTSRSPVIIRRKTQKEALIAVEEHTGIYAHRWVIMGSDDTSIHSFTGTHEERYSDTAQYKPARLED